MRTEQVRPIHMLAGAGMLLSASDAAFAQSANLGGCAAADVSAASFVKPAAGGCGIAKHAQGEGGIAKEAAGESNAAQLASGTCG